MAENYLHIYIEAYTYDFDFPWYIEYVLNDDRVNPDIRKKYYIYNSDNMNIDDFYFDIERKHIFVTRHEEELDDDDVYELERYNFEFFFINNENDVFTIKEKIIDYINKFTTTLHEMVSNLGDKVIVIAED